jgi:hypothetical protein
MVASVADRACQRPKSVTSQRDFSKDSPVNGTSAPVFRLMSDS